jgi:gas vesicle protein
MIIREDELMSQQNEQNKSNESNINTKDFVIGTLIGGIIGATTALLLAPKSGKELRNNLNEQAGAIKDKTSQWKDTAVEKGTELATVAKEKSASISKTVQDQSNGIVGKLKTYRSNGQEDGQKLEETAVEDTSLSQNEQDMNQKLEETIKAFDETEKTYSK